MDRVVGGLQSWGLKKSDPTQQLSTHTPRVLYRVNKGVKERQEMCLWEGGKDSYCHTHYEYFFSSQKSMKIALA